MIFLTGFSEDEVRLIKEAFDDIPVYEIPGYCGDWHEGKFFLMHDLGNDEVKEALKKIKSLGFKEVIYATTTPNSLTMKIDELIEEWLEEDAYFRSSGG